MISCNLSYIEIVSILVSFNRHLDSFGVHVGK